MVVFFNRVTDLSGGFQFQKLKTNETFFSNSIILCKNSLFSNEILATISMISKHGQSDIAMPSFAHLKLLNNPV